MPFLTTATTPFIKKSHDGGQLEQPHSQISSRIGALGRTIRQRLVVPNFIRRLRKAKPDQQTQIQKAQSQAQLKRPSAPTCGVPGVAPRIEQARIRALRLDAAGRVPKGTPTRQCRLNTHLHQKALLAARGPSALQESVLVQGEEKEEEIVMNNVPKLGRGGGHMGGAPCSDGSAYNDGACPNSGLAIRTREGAAVDTAKRYNDREVYPGVWMML